MKRELDIAIISDVHLGTYGCHAKELLNYLGSIKPKTLILNGDFIDIWQFKKNWFPADHLKIIQKLLKMSSKGTEIYYLTGNHDDALRHYSDFNNGNIHLRDKLELEIKGEKYLIFHGDVFDFSVNLSPFLAKIGGKGYDWLIVFNRFINRIRISLGLSPRSFAKKIKESVKKAVKFVDDFEQTAVEVAAKQGCQYVVCGHIHKAQLKKVKTANGEITYMNSGDWVESLTALEFVYNDWSIYEYNEVDYIVLNNWLETEKVKPKKPELESILMNS
jgi:UDP-2,3-diacylglucosamine pyrophosphatase LpxH